MAKREYIRLPKGTAVYPKLDEVDVYQPKKKDGTPKGPAVRKFVTRIAFEPEQMAQAEKDLREAAKKLGLDPKTVKLPFKTNKDGGLELEAKRAEKLGPPMMFDAKNNKLPTLAIGGGSILRLKVAVNDYENDDEQACINLYIDQVQVIKLVEKNSAKSSFEEADGEDIFVYDGEKSEAKAEGPDLDGDGSEAIDL
jgi:hypothetical protein